MFDQISWHLMAEVGWHIKFTIIRKKNRNDAHSKMILSPFKFCQIMEISVLFRDFNTRIKQ